MQPSRIGYGLQSLLSDCANPIKLTKQCLGFILTSAAPTCWRKLVLQAVWLPPDGAHGMRRSNVCFGSKADIRKSTVYGRANS